jgi:CBS domain-containing protein
MAQIVADILTRNASTIEKHRPVAESAELMRDVNAGAVIVLDNGSVTEIVTDRDIVVRILAEHQDPERTAVGQACSDADLQTVGPDTTLTQVVQIMGTKAIRRLPVVDNDQAVGIVSIGDLTLETDGQPALADISSALSNTWIDRLLVADLVTRRDNPENRREVVLSLTSAGRRIVRKVTNRRRQEIRRIVETMPATHRANMIRALRAFSEAAGEPDLSGDSSLGW